MKGFISIFILVAIMVVMAGCAHSGPYYKDGIYHSFSEDIKSPKYLSQRTRKAIPACVWNGNCQKVKFAEFKEVR